KVHLRNIFGKIGAASRTEATLYAVRTGLVRVGDLTTPVALGHENGESLAVAPAPTVTQTLERPPEVDIAVEPPVVARPDVEVPADPLVAPDTQTASTRSIDRRWIVGGVVALLAVAALVFALTRNTPTTQQPATPTAVGAALPDLDQRWHELPAMPAARAGFALATFTKDGTLHLYAIGGDVDGKVSNEVISYNANTQAWVKWDSKPTAVSDVQAAVIGNTIYVPGGRLGDGQASNVFEAYNPQNNRWSTLKPLPQPRSGYGLAAVEGKLYLFGGWDGTTYRAEVWQYNPDQDEWAERTSMPTARAYAGTAALDGSIYVVGGENKDGALTTNERYNPSNDSAGDPWATQQPLLEPRSHIAAVAANGRLFVIGGPEGNDPLFVYSNSWQPQPIPLGALRDLRAQLAGDKLYIVGGQNDAKASANVFEYQAFYTVMLPVGQPSAP
ncbi:MAG TPA: kelch repeat-containing protein, partial [Roseiflexaceae bacterium]|nr:kelch repeat-containing protein [Roseiflexaceae bacterium]